MKKVSDSILCFTTKQGGGERSITETIIGELGAIHATTIVYLPSITTGPLRLLRELAATIMVAYQAIRTSNPKIIYTTRLIPLWVASCCFPKIGCVFHFHGNSYGKIKADYPLKHIYIKIWYWLQTNIERSAIAHVHTIIVPMDNSNLDSEKTIIIPNGINQHLFHPLQNSQKKQQVLWVGRISEEKNPELLLTLAKHIPQLAYVLAYPASGTEYESALLRTAKQIKNITCQRDLTPKQLAKLYNESILTLLTSTSETQPLVFLESAACGTPVMTGPLPSLSPLHPPRSSLQMKSWEPKRWIRALQSYSPSKEQSQQYRHQVQPYTTSNMTAAIIKLLSSLVVSKNEIPHQ